MNNKKFETSLWTLTFSPLTWATYLLLTYITSAIRCAKATREAGLGAVRVSIAIYTLVALFLVGTQIVKGYRQHRMGNAQLPHDGDTAEDRERFLGFANFLISSLSALGIIFLAFNAFIFRSCH